MLCEIEVPVSFQNVSEVTGFSCQYGSYNSISYVAVNVVGSPQVYPEYGDFAETFSTRSYGPWWLEQSLSYRHFVVPLPKGRVVRSLDYLEVGFDYEMYPKDIKVYETYNPGSIVRILALDSIKKRWKEIWAGRPTKGSEGSVIFKPSLTGATFPTRSLRLEFNQAHLDYYAQIDAVLLGGTWGCTEQRICWSDRANANHPLPSPKTCSPSPSGFHTLPHELLAFIFSYLDLLSLCRLAATCKLFRRVCYDRIFYQSLDLQPYWEKVDDEALEALQGRSVMLEKLNLSWCGANGSVTMEAFVRFMELRGEFLHCLCLSCCPFVDNECLKVIADECVNLKELDLRGCCNPLLNRLGFLQISHLSKLTWLDLYRTEIEMFSLISIVRSCSNLDHLCLGSCPIVNNYDDIALELGTYLRGIRSLDLFRARTLSAVGVNLLARSCHRLVSLDLGWCTSVESGCIPELVRECPNLRRLLFTAIRVVCDADLFAIANYCKHLEQLDILGSSEATAAGVLRVLNDNKLLNLLDVSFCCKISAESVSEWRTVFPSVQIKRSISNVFR
ncbi:hypothetical protein ISCGN_018519 [Ixodes scapularis]